MAAITHREVAVLQWQSHFEQREPDLLDALAVGGLRVDQKEALFRSLQIAGIGDGIGGASVARARRAAGDPADEFLLIDRGRWARIMSLVARTVHGRRADRDAVRSRIALALRAARYASQN
jgi:hypothetical protein